MAPPPPPPLSLSSPLPSRLPPRSASKSAPSLFSPRSPVPKVETERFFKLTSRESGGGREIGKFFLFVSFSPTQCIHSLIGFSLSLFAVLVRLQVGVEQGGVRRSGTASRPLGPHLEAGHRTLQQVSTNSNIFYTGGGREKAFPSKLLSFDPLPRPLGRGHVYPIDPLPCPPSPLFAPDSWVASPSLPARKFRRGWALGTTRTLPLLPHPQFSWSSSSSSYSAFVRPSFRPSALFAHYLCRARQGELYVRSEGRARFLPSFRGGEER